MGKSRFSVAFDEGAGGFGPYVVARGRSGPVVRRRAVYRRRSTPEQLAQEGRLKRVAAAWGELGAAEARAWGAYAAGIEKRDPVSGTAYSPTGYNVFSGLALRLVQMDAAAAIPALPPTGRFMGDRVVVEVGSGSPSFHSGERKGLGDGESGASGSLPLTPSLASERGGILTFSASTANAPGVVTELLTQRLANVRRTPTAQYKSAGFVAFVQGSLSADVPVEAGTYACAARFVERATGRATGLTPLGVVTVA